MSRPDPPDMELVQFMPDCARFDRRFLFSYPLEDERLLESVSRAGVAQPVWVRPGSAGEGYTLVSGFRRACSAEALGLKTIPALLFTNADLYGLFLSHVQENAAIRKLNSVEQAHIAHNARTGFNRADEDIIENLMPALGLAKSRKLFNIFMDIAGYGPVAKSLIARLGMSAGQTSALCRFDDPTRERLCGWLTDKRFGLNRACQLIEMIYEICAVEKLSAPQVIESVEKSAPDRLAPPALADWLFGQIRERRYPNLAEMETDFQKVVENLGLPACVRARPPRNFEGRALEFVIKADRPSAVISSADALADAGEAKLKRLFGFL